MAAYSRIARNAACSSTLASAAIQRCNRSIRGVAPATGREGVSLMPPWGRGECRPAWGSQGQPVGGAIVARGVAGRMKGGLKIKAVKFVDQCQTIPDRQSMLPDWKNTSEFASRSPSP